MNLKIKKSNNYKKYHRDYDSSQRRQKISRDLKKSKNIFIKLFGFFVLKVKKWNKKFSQIKWPSSVNRFNFIFLSIVFLYAYFIYTLYGLQIVKGSEYRKIVDGQSSGTENPETILNRGEIYFTNKDGENIIAAGMKTTYSLIISPRDIQNPQDFFEIINNIVPVKKDLYEKLLQNKKSQYQILRHEISVEQKEDIQKLAHRGVYIEEKTKRFYPLGSVGSEILGFVSTDPLDGIRKGMYGLEKQYEGILSYSESLKATGLFKKIFSTSKNIFSKKVIADDGYIKTTIDFEVQKKLQDVLVDVDTTYGSQFSSGIVIKPYSGEVVALGTSKAFDANNNPKDYRLMAVENRYEFGSIFKPLVVAIALETKAITKDFSFNDRGFMVLNQRRIQNYDGKGRGVGTNIFHIISQSLNTGVTVMALRTGVTDFVSYLDELGLSTETNIDLPGETFGNISNLNSGEDIELATASFGQGMSLTTTGVVKAMSAIASGGSVPDLHVVDKIVYKQYMDDLHHNEKRKRVFSSDTANFVRDIMVKSADTVLKDGAMKRDFHKVAVKTGTAQIVNPEGGYYDDRNIHSFIGFFPATAPVNERYLVFMYTYNPKGVAYSSESLTYPFFEMTDFLINHYDLPPDRNESI